MEMAKKVAEDVRIQRLREEYKPPSLSNQDILHHFYKK
jgi:hypothetical protein